MTRIEIINEIKPILEELNYPDAVSYLTQNDVNWLKENIKALEQQPCTDAISREMALDCDMSIRLNKSVITQYPVGEYDYLSLRRACFHGIELAKHEMENYLIDLPSVTPQPKTGRWIHKKNALGEDITVCSECGTQMRQGEIKYCGACGTKMEVEE